MQVVGPALAMLDIGDIPPGLRALDALAKEAEVSVVSAGTIQRGHYLILFGGEVGPVEMSFHRALALAGAAVEDAVLLPHAEERIVPSMMRGLIRWPAPGDTLGVVQTGSPPTMLAAVDAALKGAEVQLVELRVADGLGGKAIANLWGELVDVQAAIGFATDAIAMGKPQRCSTTIIPRADDAVVQAISSGTRFFGEWRG
jgi:bacterial microcompartment shell protein